MVTVLIGFLSGIISGMGIGGGAVLIPALIITQGIEQKLAQGINLVYFLPTAVFALIIHIKNRCVDFKTAAAIGSCGILGAIMGSALAMYISGEVLRRMFGVFLGLIGLREIYKGIKTKPGVK